MFEDIVETVREPLIVLDSDLRVLSANRSFYKSFRVTPDETIGNLIYDLGNRQWDIPKLRTLLEDILPKNNKFDDYEVEHIFSNIGHKIMLLNARRIIHKEKGSQRILLAIEDITERRQLKSLLEVNEAKYRELVQNANSIILKMDPKGKVTFFNEFAQMFFGYTEEEMLGRSVVGTIVPETGSSGLDHDFMIKDIGINPEKYITNENENMRRNGERVWVAWTNKAIRDGKGKVIEILCIGNDITERRQLEILLSESEERYRRLFETADDGILLLEKREGNITHANPAITKMLGYTKEECIGKKLKNIGFSLAVDDFKKIIQELDKNGIIYYDDVPVQTKVGQTFYADIYMVDRARLVQCNIRNISVRKAAKEALRESEERFRLITETMTEVFWIADVPIEKMLYVNPACELVWGRSRKSLYENPRSFLDAVHPADLERVLAALEIEKAGQPFDHEYRITRPDGSIRWIWDRGFPTQDKTGKVIRYVGVAADITERKKAEESLREALKEVKQLKDQLHEENLYLRKEINLIHSHKDIVGNSEAIRTVLNQIEQVAPTDSTVLIQGETGTGKELVAHAIHGLSSRKHRLMIKVNCGALPPTLIASELFGREKGAFTGALSKQIGRFELADASTIFLDEIDALPLDLQAKLLRVLESGEFERLGSPRTVKVDVRIISATNCDLAKVVSEGGFREDLYYRLNVFQIIVPPLRERRKDILPLLWSFVQEFSKRMGKRIESIPQKGVEALQAYPWPGNVRELRNVTERAMIITTGPVLHLDVPKIAQSGADPFGTLEDVEKRHIIKALNTTGWRVSGKDGAAEILGINPKTLESRMQKLGIQKRNKNT